MKEGVHTGGALGIRHRRDPRKKEKLYRLLLVFLGVYLLVMGATMASAYSTSALPVKETFAYEFSNTMQVRNNVTICLSRNTSCNGYAGNGSCNSWNNTCTGWNNYTTCGQNTYFFSLSGVSLVVQNRSSNGFADSVRVSGNLVRTVAGEDVVGILKSGLTASAQLNLFNSRYCWYGRNMTGAEAIATKTELKKVLLWSGSSNISFNTSSGRDIYNLTSMDFSANLRLSKVGKLSLLAGKFGNNSLNWTVTSQADWENGTTRVNVSTTDVVGSVVLATSGTDTVMDTIGGTTNPSGQGTGYARASKLVASATYTISKIGLNIQIAAGNISVGIYNATGNTVLGESASAPAVVGWNDLALITPVVVTIGTTYYIAFQNDKGITAYYADIADLYYKAQTYGAFQTGLTYLTNIAFNMRTLETAVTYPSSGTLVSPVFDAGDNYTFKNLTANVTYPSQCQPNCWLSYVNISYSQDGTSWTNHPSTWGDAVPNATTTWDTFAHFDARYIQWGVTLHTDDTNYTPVLHDIVVYYDNIAGGGGGANPPNWTSVSANVTYAKNGSIINVTTVGANDSDGSDYRLIVGSSNFTEEWLNTSLVSNGTNPYGSFTFNFTDNSLYTFYARLKDNTSLNSTNLTFDITADNYRPNLSVSLPVNGGNYATQNVVLNYTVDDNGSGINKVWYTINGSSNTTTNGSNTTANFTGDGYWVLQVWANDTLGWTNNSANITILIDATKPSLTLYSPNSTNLSNASGYNSLGFLEANLSYQASDSGIGISSIWYEVWDLTDDTGTKHNVSVTANGTFNVSDEGQYTFKLWANDSLGNTNNTSNVTFWFDLPPILTNPNASDLTPAIGNTVNLSVIIADNLTTVSSARVAIAYPSSAVISYSLTSGSGVWYYLFPANIYGTFTVTFYANDVSTTTENSSTSVTFTVPGPLGGSIPSTGGPSVSGATPTPTPTATPEIITAGILAFKPYKIDDTLWIAPWDVTPGRNYPITTAGVVSNCEASGNVSCEVITPTRLVLRYQPPTLAWNMLTQEIKASAEIYGENNGSSSIPIKIRVVNFGLYVPWELSMKQFAGRNFFFKVEKDMGGVEHVRGILIYWMVIVGALLLISGEKIYKLRKEKEARTKAYWRNR